MKKKILIIGSNFAASHHLKVISKLYKKCYIHICSPNIYKKNFNRKIEKYKSYEEILDKNTYFLIVCCATISAQTNFIKYFVDNKKKAKNIILEKPISKNLTVLKKFLNYSKKNNIKLSFNYTYSNLKIIKKINQIYKKTKKKYLLNFNLKFMHPYYVKKNNSWKNFISEGGGIINYYITHILFSCILIFGQIQLKLLNIKKNNKNKIKAFELIFYTKELDIIMNIDVCSKNYTHKYEFYSQKTKNIFLTKKNNWYLEYEHYNNKNKKITYKENILDLIEKNYKNLNKKIISQNEYLSKIYYNEELCNKINKKLAINDFKKL